MVLSGLVSATNTLFATGITTGVLSNLFGKVKGSMGGVKNNFFK